MCEALGPSAAVLVSVQVQCAHPGAQGRVRSVCCGLQKPGHHLQVTGQHNPDWISK